MKLPPPATALSAPPSIAARKRIRACVHVIEAESATGRQARSIVPVRQTDVNAILARVVLEETEHTIETLGVAWIFQSSVGAVESVAAARDGDEKAFDLVALERVRHEDRLRVGD